MTTSYSDEVFKFGMINSTSTNNDCRKNLSHKVEFSIDDVVTDGLGNIIDQPLLDRKPCFARPEAYISGMLKYSNGFVDKNGIQRAISFDTTPCGRCPEKLQDACGRITDERIASSPDIKAAYDQWDHIIDNLPNPLKWHLNAIPQKAWSNFLHSIKNHGGWTTVNDSRLDAYKLAKLHLAKKNKALARRNNNALKRASRRKILSPSCYKKLEDGAVERLKILNDIKYWNSTSAPKYISRLDDEGIKRTVDVWKHKTLLERQGMKATGVAIASSLLNSGVQQYAKSSTIWVNKDLKRIERLEDGGVIWKKFTW